jgi:hypothetical protein
MLKVPFSASDRGFRFMASTILTIIQFRLARHWVYYEGEVKKRWMLQDYG